MDIRTKKQSLVTKHLTTGFTTIISGFNTASATDKHFNLYLNNYSEDYLTACISMSLEGFCV